MTSARRKARNTVLQILYEIDLAGHCQQRVIEQVLETSSISVENDSFVRGLVLGILSKKDELDRYIKRFAPTWPLAQLSYIDRNILRLSIYELLYCNETPYKVSINEAVELAKTFGSDSSPKFINGVLSSVIGLMSTTGDSTSENNIQ